MVESNHHPPCGLSQVIEDKVSNLPDLVDEGLSITGCYTDKNRTGKAFIALASNAEEQKFRQVLQEVLSRVVGKEHGVYQT